MDKQTAERCPGMGQKTGEMMNIVFLDADSIGSDIDLSGFDQLGNVTIYGHSTNEQVPQRIYDADIAIVNKTEMNEATIQDAPRLKLICVTATGTNILDKEFLAKRNIRWNNVAGYSTENVSQHTFALLFYLYEKMSYYDAYVKEDRYVNDTCFSHFANPYHELCGKTWGIIGLGAIGRRVADIAKAFGCHVIYYSPSGSRPQEGYKQVNLDTLLTIADIVSVHAPLTEKTENLMNAAAFDKMKPSAIFINVGRGPIMDEQALADAIENGKIAGAGLDVLSEEPMAPDNPLRRIKDSTKLVITPHIAWASVEARARLMEIVLNQVKEFVDHCYEK